MSEREEREEFKLEQEAKFKTEKFYFSFSSLVKLLLDPRRFYKDYVLREREDISAKHLDIGSLLHCLVLEPENFEDNFVIMTKKVPGGKLKDVIDTVYKVYAKDAIKNNPAHTYSLPDFDTQILVELHEHDLYQGLVDAKKATNGVKLTANEKRLEKALTPETEAYFKVLMESEKKTIVDMDMSMKARDKANAIMNNKKAMELLTSKSIKQDVRKELELKVEAEGLPFGLKGILDCVKIDYETATIHIVDLKTTSKSLDQWKKDFATSEYNYWLQPIVYKELLMAFVPKESATAWKFKIHYIVVDKINQVYCFPVSDKSLKNWELLAKGVYEIATWHLENHSYELPYEYEQDLVEL